MTALAYWMPPLHLDRCARLADGLAIALAVSLPWSTTATGILVVLWLIALVPTLDPAALRRVLATPAGGLPVLLWALGVIGMLWAVDISMAERLNGVRSFHRLLVIPLLIVQFQRSDRGAWVLKGFVWSCVAMLALSWLLLWKPGIPLPFRTAFQGTPGIVVKDYIAQGAEFTVCIFLLLGVAIEVWRRQRHAFAVLLVVLAAIFLANVLHVSPSRAPFAVIPALVLLFAIRGLPWQKAGAIFILAFVILGGLAWSVPMARYNLNEMVAEASSFRPDGERTRVGERLEYWRKSVGFIADAPVIGHGTGSINDRFRRSAAGETGMAALASTNPHNQTLAVAIQLGFLGTAVLWAMWFAHALIFFRGEGMAAWAGLTVAVHNIVSSLFNSFLFDFTSGWGYVIGVGVAAGFLLRQERVPPQAAQR